MIRRRVRIASLEAAIHSSGALGAIDKSARSCPHHEDAACCPECPDVNITDGIGFPHRDAARGRRLLQRCKRCGRMVPPERWVHAPARAFFGCRACARRGGRAS